MEEHPTISDMVGSAIPRICRRKGLFWVAQGCGGGRLAEVRRAGVCGAGRPRAADQGAAAARDTAAAGVRRNPGVIYYIYSVDYVKGTSTALLIDGFLP